MRLFGAGLVALGICLSCVGTASADFVNGGFEAGDFTGWTVTNQDGNTLVTTAGFDNFNPHGGAFFAALGKIGLPLTGISQTVATTAGQSYTLSMFLGSDGATTNEFKVVWNGVTLIDGNNLPDTRSNPSQYNLLTFNVIGTGSDTLDLLSRNDPGFLALDDISLQQTATPEPSSMILFGIGGLGCFALYRRRKQVTA